jgi:hypothetical protein
VREIKEKERKKAIEKIEKNEYEKKRAMTIS